MTPYLFLRPLSPAEAEQLTTWAHGQRIEARLRDRATICLRSHDGTSVATIAAEFGIGAKKVCRWITRFNAEGLAGLTDRLRSGRPATYTPTQVGDVVELSLTDPTTLELPFATWTLDRLVTQLHETKAIPMQRTRLAEILHAEGLRWRTQESWFGEQVDPDFAKKRGPS